MQMVHPTAATITGPRKHFTGMYLVNLKKLTSNEPPSPTTHLPVLNHVYDMRTKVDLVTYHHLCVWSPVVGTWLKVIDNNFYTTWPGLTSTLVKKHLTKSMSSAKGHLNLTRQNVRSTKPPTATPTPNPTIMKNDVPSKGPHIRTNLVTIKCIDLSGKIATDQTGHFPVQAEVAGISW